MGTGRLGLRPLVGFPETLNVAWLDSDFVEIFSPKDLESSNRSPSIRSDDVPVPTSVPVKTRTSDYCKPYKRGSRLRPPAGSRLGNVSVGLETRVVKDRKDLSDHPSVFGGWNQWKIQSSLQTLGIG